MLHVIDARVKEVWLIAALLLLARASATMRLAIACGQPPQPRPPQRCLVSLLVILCLYSITYTLIHPDLSRCMDEKVKYLREDHALLYPSAHGGWMDGFPNESASLILGG